MWNDHNNDNLVDYNKNKMGWILFGVLSFFAVAWVLKDFLPIIMQSILVSK